MVEDNKLNRKEKSTRRKGIEVKFCYIKAQAMNYPVRILCRVMKLGKSAFYTWHTPPEEVDNVAGVIIVSTDRGALQSH